MASEILEVEARLKDLISNRLAKIEGNLRGFSRVAQNSFRLASKSGKQFEQTVKGFVTAQIIIGGTRRAWSGLVGTVKDGVELYKIQARAETELRTALGYTSKALLTQATALQAVTQFGDEATIKAQALVGAFIKNETQIAKVIPLVQDLAVGAFKGQLEPAAALIAKTLGSSTNALSRYGIEVVGAVGSAERLESLMVNLERAFGGQARAIGVTDVGKLEITLNRLGDIKEELGKEIIPYQIKWNELILETVQGFQQIFGAATKSPVAIQAEMTKKFNVQLRTLVQRVKIAEERGATAKDLILGLDTKSREMITIKEAKDTIALLKRMAKGVGQPEVGELSTSKTNKPTGTTPTTPTTSTVGADRAGQQIAIYKQIRDKSMQMAMEELDFKLKVGKQLYDLTMEQAAEHAEKEFLFRQEMQDRAADAEIAKIEDTELRKLEAIRVAQERERRQYEGNQQALDALNKVHEKEREAVTASGFKSQDTFTKDSLRHLRSAATEAIMIGVSKGKDRKRIAYTQATIQGLQLAVELAMAGAESGKTIYDKIGLALLGAGTAAALTAPKIAAIKSQSFAGGTHSAPGGPALVGEHGPEIMDVPRGSRVYTAGETRNIMNRGPTYITLNLPADSVITDSAASQMSESVTNLGLMLRAGQESGEFDLNELSQLGM